MERPDTERALRARIAAYTSWAATTDRTARTAPARRAFQDRFFAQVDPAITDPVERATAAEHLRKAYYTRLALKSAQARRRRSTQDATRGRPRPSGGECDAAAS